MSSIIQVITFSKQMISVKVGTLLQHVPIGIKIKLSSLFSLHLQFWHVMSTSTISFGSDVDYLKEILH